LQFDIAALGSNFYNATMSNNSKVLILANGSSGSVLAEPEPTPQFLFKRLLPVVAGTPVAVAVGGLQRVVAD
jgi:hypothetical protein